MTIDPFVFWWTVLVGLALLGVPLNRWRKDISARQEAEARAERAVAWAEAANDWAQGQKDHIATLEALVAAERQRADAAEAVTEDWRYRCDEWRMDAHAQERIAIALDPHSTQRSS